MSNARKIILSAGLVIVLLHSAFPPRVSLDNSTNYSRHFIGSDFFRYSRTETVTIEGFAGKHTFGKGTALKVNMPNYLIGLVVISSVTTLTLLWFGSRMKPRDNGKES